MSVSCKLHIEIKIGEKWHHYSCPPKFWDTQLYALIAGLSHNTKLKRIFDQCDPPTDLTEVTFKHFMYDKEDAAHHFTVLNMDQVIQLDKVYKKRCNGDLCEEAGYLFGHGWRWLQDDLSNEQWKKLGLTDFRWIIWFTC